MRQISFRLFRALNLVMVVLMALANPMSAMAATWTDRPDYSPGSKVYISGDNSNFAAGEGYLSGEMVLVTVQQPVIPEPLICTATVDANGAWTCYVTLVNSLDAVGLYLYTAEGQTSHTFETGTFTDAVGDFSLNFIAAEPTSYNHQVGGGAFDDATKNFDVVESLEGGDFACGDIVTLFTKISVDDTARAGTDGPQTIQLDYEFLMDTTGASGVAIGDITYVGVNYNEIVDLIPGENSVDDGMNDDKGSAATLLNETQTGPMFQPGSKLRGKVEITDLERNEDVIVRVDVRLYCKPGTRPTGNLQADITTGWLTYIKGTSAVTPPAKIQVGNQTIPFLQFGDIPAPALVLNKTVTTENGTCPGVESMDILSGETVKYCYEITNPSDVTDAPGATLFDVTLTDNAHTPTDDTDNYTVILTGLTDVDGDGSADDLIAGGSAIAEVTKTITETAVGTYTNTATAHGSSVPNDTNYLLTDTDTAAVVINAAPAITVTKTGSPTTVPENGASVTFTYKVENTGNVPVTISSLSDDKFGTLAGDTDCQVGTVLAVDGWCSFESDFAIPAGESGTTHTNTFTAHATYSTTDVQDDDDETITRTDVLPTVDLTKTVTPLSLADPGGEFTYTLTIKNTSIETVTITALTDDNSLPAACTDLITTTLAAGASTTCTYKVSHAEAGSYPNTASVTVKDNEDNEASDSDNKTVTVTDVLPMVDLTKTASPSTLPEPGGVFTFTLNIENKSVEAVTITTLTDTNALSADCLALVGTTLAVGASTSCTYTITHTEAGNYPNTASVTVKDNENNTASDSDDETVTVTDVLPTVELTKAADPTTLPEPGGDFTFTLEIKNTSVEAVTITALTDDNVLSEECTALIDTSLAAGASSSCSYTVSHVNAGTYPNTASVTVKDNENNEATDTDDETVTVTNDLPDISVTKTASPTHVPETGGGVTFTFVVTNVGVEEVTLTSLTDDQFGDLNGQGDCVTGGLIAVGGSYTCSVTKWLASDSLTPHTNIVTAVATDDDGTTDTATDAETVAFDDEAPAIRVTKTANPTHVPETGGDVTFTFLVENIGVEDVTLTSLSDTVFGDLDGKGSCDVPQEILIGGSYSCTYTINLASDSLTAHYNVVTATAVDDEDTTATDTDNETVTFDDVAPDISITKAASPTHLPETGGNVTFTFIVTNIGVEDVTLTSLTDTVFGDLNGQGDCVTGGLIAMGGSYECSITKSLASDSLIAHYNVVTAVGTDDDGTTDTATDDETVTFDDVPPAIQITKTAYPSSVLETGGDVTFTFVVENTGLEDVTLTSLLDDVFGDLNGQGTCAVPQTILIGGSYSCSYTVWLASDSLTAHTNVVTATAVDDDGSQATDDDNETVTFDDVAPMIQVTKTASPTHVPETGGNVTFTFLVENTGQEDVTLTSLSDTVFGDLDGKGTCIVPQTILIGGSYSCTYTVFLASDSLTPHYNVATATAVDDDDTPATDSDDETVTFDDVAPSIRVTKTADPTHVAETGGDVTFTFLVQNTGQEDVTLTSLADTVFGDLNEKGTCAVPQTILIGEEYSCTYTVFLSSDSLTAHYNVVTATAVDDDGTEATDYDDETVTFTDVAPLIRVTKTASPTSVPETGGNVTFTFLVENIGQEDVTLTSLMDTVFGDLNGKGNCVVPQTILIGGSYTCEYTVFLASDSLTAHFNVVTATAVDDDNTPASDTDDETVTFTDVAPEIRVTKTADPTHVPETGGDVTFTFLVENIGQEDVTLTSLSDTVFGDLNGKGICMIPQTILIGGSYSCTYTIKLASDSLTSHYNVVTATAVDDDGTQATDNDDETVIFDNVAPEIRVTKTADPTHVPETGGNVTFTFLVENIGQEDVTLTSLNDTVFGDLNGQGDCVTGGLIAIGDSYICSVTKWLASDSLTAHYNVVTAVGTDDDGTTDTATDDETVTFIDVAPDISITKTASPTHVPETGRDVTFTFVVSNDGVEDVTLTSLNDTVFGDLNGQGDCVTGGLILIGDSYTCSITKFLASDSLTAHYNVVTAVGTDDDGTTDTATDNETVTFDDVAPAITITKTADPTHVPETGENVTFTFLVENTGKEDVTLTNLTDTVFGNLNGQGTCVVPQTILIGGSYSCSITAFLASGSLTPHTNLVTADAVDDDGTPATDDDDETVTFDDILPTVELTKSANPDTLPEPGGVFTFTLTIENTSPEAVEITALTDDYALSAECLALVNTILAAGESTSCTYTVTHTEAGSYDNTASVTVKDNDGNPVSDSDDETVTVTDVLPTVDLTKAVTPSSLAEPGGFFTFTLTVKNTSVETVMITALTDDNPLPAECTALIGTTLAAGASTTCTYTVTHNEAGSYPNTATVTVKDNENNTASDSDSQTVEVTDVLPTVDLTKSADPAERLEPGGIFTFTLSITNTSVEPVTLTALSDDNALSDECIALVGTTLTVGQTVDCEYSVTHTEAGSYENTASVTVKDNEGKEASDSDDETVTVTDVLPSVDLTKSATPTTLPEPGGVFTFTLFITNNSIEDVTITALTDDNLLSVECQALVGTTLAAGASTSCTYTVTHTEAGIYPNTANVTVKDNENNLANDSDGETVTVTDVLPTVDLTKTADPATLSEPGGEFTFTLTVENTSVEAVTITALTDTNSLSDECKALVGTVLAAGGSTSCTYSVNHTEAGSYENTASVTVRDNEANEASDTDKETVMVTDVLPVVDLTKSVTPSSLPEPGGVFTFTLTLHNTSVEAVKITALTDDNALSAECLALIDTTLAAGASTTCSYTVTHIEAGGYDNTASVTVEDNEGNDASDSDDETVTVTDVLPTVDLTKAVTPSSLPEPGGVFAFTLTITNTSVETVTITTLTDSNALSAECLALVGTTLAAGESKSCGYTVTHTEADSYENNASVTVEDNEGNPASDTDSETVTVTDVLPTVEITKSADPATLPEPGGEFTFTLSITNTSVESVTISALTDDNPLPAECTDLIGTTLAAGASTSCSYTVSYTEYGSYPNTAAVTVADNEGNQASDTDDETVTVTDALPDIAITKTADPTSVPETGGWVTFTFLVTNNSVEAVSIVTLTDTIFNLPAKCPSAVDTVLQPQGTYTCFFDAWITGDFESGVSHENTATVTAVDNEGNSDEASDDATVDFTDVDPQIDVEKYVSIDGGATWLDADLATGPMLLSGTAPEFKIVVTNIGTVDLANVTVTDDKFGSIAASVDLAAGDSQEYFITGTWTAGQHTNVATASGSITDGAGTETDTDTDAANYYGANPSFTIEKSCISVQPIAQDGSARFSVTIVNNGNVALEITADDGIGTFTLEPGASKISSVTLAGPYNGIPSVSNTASATASYTDDALHSVTIDHSGSAECRVGSYVQLLKLTQGVVDPTKAWTFSVFSGINGYNSGQSIEIASTFGDADGILTFNNLNLDKNQSYTLCELAVPVSWTANWLYDSNKDGSVDSITIPYNPNAGDNPPQDLGHRCVDFGAGTNLDLLTDGGTLIFKVNNTYPGGGMRTPGYWKNWNRVTKGGQAENADRNGGWSEGYWLVEDVLDPSIGGGIVWDDILSDSFVFPITHAAVAVDILDRRQVGIENQVGDGRKMSNDPAYALASHLLAAQLNFGAGAETCDAAVTAVQAGEELLDKLNFNGNGSYLSSKGATKADYYFALEVATLLDQYNNGLLCTGVAAAVDNPPAVTIVDPLANATVFGMINILANAVDDIAVLKMQFYVDGILTGEDTNDLNGWSAPLDTTALAEGSHVLKVTGTDTKGQTGSYSITITVDNLPEPPTVSITGVSALMGDSTVMSIESVVSGTVSIQATASSNAGGEITQVEFFMDGVSLGVDNVPADGWSVTWDTLVQFEGMHNLTAVATDTFGQSTTSAAVSLTVDNDASPSVTLISPVEGDLVPASLTIQAEANDLEGIRQVAFYVDGSLIGSADTDDADGWSVDWNSTAVLDGSHILKAVVTDVAEQTAESSINVVTDNFNDNPIISISSPANGAEITGANVNITATAGDDRGVTQVQFFVEGNLIGTDTTEADGWSVIWDLAGVDDDSYTITATATDNDGASASSSSSLAINNLPDPKIKVGTLTPSSGTVDKKNWKGTVTITVNPALAGALVSVDWGNGTSASCTTAEDGTCKVSIILSNRISSIKLTVTQITLSGYEFETGNNTVTVNKP